MATKKCVICGKEFNAPPSSKKITCSQECSSARKSQSHKGVRNQWNKESRAKLSAQGRTANLLLGTPAARASPISGPFETNRNAKHWILKSPEGILHEFDNLNLFIRSHPEWFSNPKSASTALRASAACLAGNPAPSRKARQFSQYKGWQVVWYGPKEKD